MAPIVQNAYAELITSAVSRPYVNPDGFHTSLSPYPAK